MIESDAGNILFGSAVLYAEKGLAFSVAPDSTGILLKLTYNDFTFDIGRIDDAAEAAKWVEDVNAFLATNKAVLLPDEPIIFERSGIHANSTTRCGGEQAT